MQITFAGQDKGTGTRAGHSSVRRHRDTGRCLRLLLALRPDTRFGIRGREHHGISKDAGRRLVDDEPCSSLR